MRLHTQAHTLISRSLSCHHPPPLNDRYYGVLYDVCTKQTQYKEVEGEEEGGRGEKREKTDR